MKLDGLTVLILLAALLLGIGWGLAGCGGVTVGPSDTAGTDGGVSTHDAAVESDRHDACPPTTLDCAGGAGACPQGQAMAVRSVCGGAAVAVCCPVNDCELALCDVCPLCAL